MTRCCPRRRQSADPYGLAAPSRVVSLIARELPGATIVIVAPNVLESACGARIKFR
jgi:hypothetical protein